MNQVLWLTRRGRRTSHAWQRSPATGWYASLCERQTGVERAYLREPCGADMRCQRCLKLEALE